MGIVGYGISPKVCLGGDGYHPLNKQKIAQDNEVHEKSMQCESPLTTREVRKHTGLLMVIC